MWRGVADKHRKREGCVKQRSAGPAPRALDVRAVSRLLRDGEIQRAVVKTGDAKTERDTAM
eukprot:219356-Pyramimonas_sp.AAC.1